MYSRLFIDSDTCLTFKNQAQAIQYCRVKGLGKRLILNVHESKNGARYSIYNPHLLHPESIEYFNTESEALHYLGSFGFTVVELCASISMISTMLLFLLALYVK